MCTQILCPHSHSKKKKKKPATHSHTAVCQLGELHQKFYGGLTKVALQLLCFSVSTFLYGGRRQDSQRAVSCFIKDLSISNYRVTTVWLRDRKLERKKRTIKWERGSQGQRMQRKWRQKNRQWQAESHEEREGEKSWSQYSKSSNLMFLKPIQAASSNFAV